MPNVAKFARALYALHGVSCLTDPACRPAVGMFVRQATETRHFHVSAHFRSTEAAGLLEAQQFETAAQYQQYCVKNLRHEHMVPISVICDMLVKAPDITEEFIADTLRRFGLRATITRDEDRVLNALGLARAMPDEFFTPGSQLFEDPNARYIHAGIPLLPRPPRDWFPPNGYNQFQSRFSP